MPRVWKPEYTEAANARRKEQRHKERKIVAEGATVVNGHEIRTLTIMIAGRPIELLMGADVGPALGRGKTWLIDWQKSYAVPPPLVLANIAYFTRRQMQLMAELGKFNGRGATDELREARNEFIRTLWRQWWG